MSYTPPDNDLILVSILNGMYNDNIAQITSLNASINNLTSINSQIRRLLVQTLSNSNRGTNRNHVNGWNEEPHRNNQYSSYGQTTYTYDAAGGGRRPSFTPENVRRYQFSIHRNDDQNTARFFDPVVVYPTQTQIDIATRRVRYRDIVTPRNIACPISMVDFSDNDIVTVIRHCGHVFATDQLNIWFATNCTCPVCRFDIRSAVAATTSATPLSQAATTSPIPLSQAATTSATPLSQAATTSSQAPATSMPATNSSPTTDPSGNNTRSASRAVPAIYDSILNNFHTVESVATLFTDSSGNYMYPDSDPLALFNLISRINDTYSRN